MGKLIHYVLNRVELRNGQINTFVGNILLVMVLRKFPSNLIFFQLAILFTGMQSYIYCKLLSSTKYFFIVDMYIVGMSTLFFATENSGVNW